MSNEKLNWFRPRIRSRHPSHDVLRNKDMVLLPCKSVIRLGSTTEIDDIISKGGNRIEINSVDSIKNSANKYKMKECFTKNKVKTADWFIFDSSKELFYQLINDKDAGYSKQAFSIEDLPFPIISKKFYGSRNNGNQKHDSLKELQEWMKEKNLSHYIFERYYNYTREYRLHVTKNGCFYACRKVLKSDTPDEHKWYRNDSHCNWITEHSENQELFDKPVNWNTLVKECINALEAVKLDIGACDVRIQSATNKDGEKRDNPKFIIVEINSAPSFGKITEQKYKEELPKLIMNKYHSYKDERN